MADSKAPTPPPPPPPTITSSPSQTSPAETTLPVLTPPTIAQDRTELLTHARVFLNSPRILNQDFAAKRKFLSEKGLSEPEIEGLLREPVYTIWHL